MKAFSADDYIVTPGPATAQGVSTYRLHKRTSDGGTADAAVVVVSSTNLLSAASSLVACIGCNNSTSCRHVQAIRERLRIAHES